MANLDDEKTLDTEVSEETSTNEVVEEEIVVEEAESEKQTVQPIKESNKKNSKKKGSSKIKGTFSELKKVTWPTFGKVVKQTLVVLSVTAVFLVVIMGIDQLLYLLYNLLTKNM